MAVRPLLSWETKAMKKTFMLGAVLALFLTVPAFASEYCTRIDARCNLPEISVVVPAPGGVFINPYKLPVSIEADDSTAQIISTPAAIENKSEVPLNLTVTISGTVKEGSSLYLTSTPTEGVGTGKRVFVYFEIQASDSADEANWDSEYDAMKHVVVRTTAKTMKNIVALDAADGTNRFGVFRLTGDCSTHPREDWTEADGVDVEIAFTFTPLPRPGI